MERPNDLQLSHVVPLVVMEFSHENQPGPFQVVDYLFKGNEFSIGKIQDMGTCGGGVPQMESDDQ
jgi:hypothetical protein